PLNAVLSQLSVEVKPIELRYEFDTFEFRQALIEHIQDKLGQDNARIDHLESMLQGVDLAKLTTYEDFVAKTPEDQKRAKILREYFSTEINFALLGIQVEKRLMDFGAYG